jgi:phage N-6-adenine-methyltransferase
MNNNAKKVMFSSKSDEWGTPKEFFKKLDADYNFTLDPCATAQNAKCKNFYTMEDNGLEKDWEGETVFVNPPYGKIKDWVLKCHKESLKPATTIVMLIPSRTDTRWWHQYCMTAHQIFFVKGRLKFEGGEHAAPFPSAVIVFKSIHAPPKINTMHR